MNALTSPPPLHAFAFVQDGFTSGHVLSIVGRCTVAYDGRTQSTLGPGDRLVCKHDGTLLVHQPTGRKPVNWQPPGGSHETALAGETVIVRSRRDSPQEVVEVRFEEIHHVMSCALTDAADLQLHGTEADFRQRILESPTLIEEGFQPLALERETSAGPVDIYGRDSDETPVIIELKRRRVGLEAVGQLTRYVIAVEREHTEMVVRDILVAPSITDRATDELARHGHEFVALEPPEQSIADS